MDLRRSKNLLLRHIPAADRSRLEPHAAQEPLAFKQPLLSQSKPVERIYFPESGVVSVVTDLEDGETVEAATVGNEGLVGVAAVLGSARSPNRAFVQIAGHATVIDARVIDEERRLSSGWFGVLLRYVSFLTVMLSQTAGCNRRHTVDARMARWLLMTHDRAGADDFPLTQEFLAMMLGVARPTVNIAGATLQRAGFIKYTRGRIAIINRDGLETASCQCYQRIRAEMEATFNGQPPRPAARPRSRRERR